MSTQKIESMIEEGLSEIYSAAALVIGSSRDAVFSKYYGSTGPSDKPASENSFFDLASLTKVIATTPLWMLLARKTPEILERPVSYWFPKTPEDKKSITPRLLLAHASGLPAWRPYYLIFNEDPGRGALAERILSEQLDCEPASREIYSDLGFMMLCAILEIEFGQRLDIAAKERLFKLLGLESEFAFKPSEELEIVETRLGDIRGAVHDLNARRLSGISGHAGLFGTAKGLDAFTRELMNSYKGGAGFFQTEIVRQFCSRAQIVEGSTRSFGFDMPDAAPSCGKFFSPESFGHTGFTGVSLWIDPVHELRVILLTNRVIRGEGNLAIKKFRPAIHSLIFEEFAK
jgi:serine-type D-Ala-D-Ala carboxypeptidase